jgi:serine/threonine-protein kinase
MLSEVHARIDNRYEILAELGRGGMGVVYKAMDTELDRLVAIKVMTSHVAGNPEFRARFDAEAKTAAKMQHPNIAVVYARGQHAGAPYIAMEFVEGTPLDKLIGSGAKLTLLQKLDCIIQVCNALHYAHTEWKVIHRDVKPANVMVLKDGQRIKLLDFGIARAATSTATKSGTAIGTTLYMSPQQVRGEKNLDWRSDIFSTGVMLYEVVTGRVPWSGDSDYEIATKIVGEPYPPLTAYMQQYPAGLDRVLARALAKDVLSRYQGDDEMASELAEVQAPLKEDIIDQAYLARDSGDILRADELALQVLRIDTRHIRALELHNQLQPQLQKKSAQLRDLREKASQAVGARDYKQALSAISEAIALSPTNSELQDYRKLIVQELERKQFVLNRLKLAQAAKDMDDLPAANNLVDEALEKDPTDTQARMMKNVLGRLVEDEQKEKRLRALAEDVRSLIAARKFPETYSALRAMEEIDPQFPELAVLKEQAAELYSKDKARRERDSALKEIEKVLRDGNALASMAATEQALQRFPTDPNFLGLREKAKAMLAAAERQSEIQKQLAAAWDLSSKKQSAAAVQILEAAVQHFGADPQLSSALRRLRDSAESERMAQVGQEILERARQAMHVKDFESAADLLRTARIDFPSSTEIKQALTVAEEGSLRITEATKLKQREAAEVLELSLAAEPHPDIQLQIVEETLRRNPGNERVEQIALMIRSRNEQLNPAVQRAEQLEKDGQDAEAVQQWEHIREIYPQYPQVESRITRLAYQGSSGTNIPASAASQLMATRWLNPSGASPAPTASLDIASERNVAPPAISTAKRLEVQSFKLPASLGWKLGAVAAAIAVVSAIIFAVVHSSSKSELTASQTPVATQTQTQTTQAATGTTTATHEETAQPGSGKTDTANSGQHRTGSLTDSGTKKPSRVEKPSPERSPAHVAEPPAVGHDVEQTDWQAVQKSASIEDWNRFLAKYPNGTHHVEADSRREDLLWARARGGADVAAVNEYLQLYPGGRYAPQIREQQDTKIIASTSDPAVLRNYLLRYPSGEIHSTIVNRLDDIVWTQSSKDAAGLQTYLTQFPTGQRATDARSALAKLSSAPKPNTSRSTTEEASASGLTLDDKTAILAALKEYTDAISTKDLTGIQRAWPNIPSNKLKTWVDTFRMASSLKASITVTSGPTIEGKNAKLDGAFQTSITINGNTNNPSQRISVKLKKSSDAQNSWKIDGIKD